MLNGAGHDASAIEDGEGEFNVVADGTLVFSKRHEGRFPQADEIVTALAAS